MYVHEQYKALPGFAKTLIKYLVAAVPTLQAGLLVLRRYCATRELAPIRLRRGPTSITATQVYNTDIYV